MRIITLLSPAKTLNWAPAPASLAELCTQPKMLKEADPVVEVMRTKSKATLKKLMSVSDKIADLNHERFKKFLLADDAEGNLDDEAADNLRPAALAYDGPAYRGLEAKTFSDEDWAFGQNTVRVLSGLYGVLRPADLIQPYRLEMGSRVGVAGQKDLYQYWKETITQCLLQDVGGTAREDSSNMRDKKGPPAKFLVVNVASQEYSKAVDFGALEKGGGKVLTCVFKDDGRVLSVFAKRARGLFARHVVERRATGVADLEAFSSEGYSLDRSQCDDGVLVFSRSKAQRTAWQTQETGRAVLGKKRTAPAAGLANTVGAGSGPNSEEVKAGKKSSTSKKGGSKSSKAKSK